MIVLGLDGSGDGVGAALVDGTGVRASCWAGPGARPAAALLQLSDQALRLAGLERTALQGLAVAVGPGSYAGIRAAVATGKALAWAADLPLAAVGSLLALACAAGPWPGLVWAASDARRGRVYAASFRWDASVPACVREPALLDAPAFLAVLAQEPCLLVGGGAASLPIPGTTAAPPLQGPALAAAVAWLGRRSLLRGERADPFTLLPVYAGEPVLGPPAKHRPGE